MCFSRQATWTIYKPLFADVRLVLNNKVELKDSDVPEKLAHMVRCKLPGPYFVKRIVSDFSFFCIFMHFCALSEAGGCMFMHFLCTAYAFLCTCYAFVCTFYAFVCIFVHVCALSPSGFGP